MSFIRTVYKKFVIGNIKETDFEPDVDQWLAFLRDLPVPRDCIDESYNKYRCRCFHFSAVKNAALNLASLPLAVWSWIALLGRDVSLPERPADRLLIERKESLDYSDVFPEELHSRYAETVEILDSRTKGESMRLSYSREAKSILRNALKRHPFSFYYLFWLARELSKHCAYIRSDNPAAIAVYIEERNVAGPVLRFFYESVGRRYLSFMHGEYLLRLIQGYMSFSEYFIWDEEYERMFREILRCNIGKYSLYTPRKLTKKWDFGQTEPEYYLTYYFSAESKESIIKLGEIVSQLEKSGKKCKVRPHPRYSRWDAIRGVFSAEQIEDPRAVSIEESFRSTRYVVGLTTTVLSEAFYEGKEIVVDDVTSPEKFANLEKRHFVVLKRSHILLSDLLNLLGEQK